MICTILIDLYYCGYVWAIWEALDQYKNLSMFFVVVRYSCST